MPCPIVILSKVIGTVSLGVLAGASTTNSLVSLPSILTNSSLQTEVDVQQQDTILTSLYQTTVSKVILPLSTVAFGSLVSAYILAPRSGQHPYLIYSALSVPIVAGLNYFYGPGISFNTLLNNFCGSLSVGKCDRTSSTKPSQETGSPAVASGADLTETKSASSTSAVSKSSEDTSSSDEPSLLDNSVYAHLDHPDKGGSDIELSSASSNIATPEDQSEDELAGQPVSSTTTAGTNYPASALSSNLSKLSFYSSIVFQLAFLISTIGIYGDLS
ncbi:hypothetical protein AWJ20_122 [Sugiyamaella lignohabitans]|uniref:Uncharacterized protein n=1 Tax=Sugiyamaella lignohabitans TaxID=796027 RepID=A0A167CMS7_9ASCO|nr:uncharacterized protein AWJ20_122 [Sugiyamaella lignohabitans]ANB11895.1 hypothetical protein AWJ20_122 [Sugiyamaella lignohabitans]